MKKPPVEKLVDIRKIIAIAKKNSIVMTRDRIRVVPLLIFPLIMITVLGFVSGNSPKHISAVMVINDESSVSAALQQSISGSDYFAVRYMVSTEGEARKLLDQGKVRVVVIIPPGLGDDLARGAVSGIPIIVDESDSAVAATAKAQLGLIVNTISAQLAAQHYASYQHSVALAGTALANYAAGEQIPWDDISAATTSTTRTLDLTTMTIDKEIQGLQLSPPRSYSHIVEANSSIAYHGQEYNVSNGTFFKVGSLAEDAMAGQLAQLGHLGASSEAALATSRATSVLVASSSAAAAAHAAAQDTGINAPMAEITAFVQSDPAATLQPLTLHEKQGYGVGLKVLDFMIPVLIVTTLFQGAVMGMGRAVAGEKRDGSLTRVFLTPTSNVTIIIGTLLFYVLFELVRASFLIIFSMIVFGTTVSGNLLYMGIVLIVYLCISTGTGMLISSIVRTEQQFTAMAMLISLPTMFLSGAFFPVQAMPSWMQVISYLLPVTYAGDALRSVMVKGLGLAMVVRPMLILLIFLGLILLGLFTFFKRDVE